MTAKKARGRPEYVPTDEAREKVQILRAQGMSKEAIAVAIDVHVDTLVKHFSVELDCAVAKKTAEVMLARFRSAIGGSVPAQNKFLELAGAIPPQPKKQPRKPALGKKEQADVDAQEPPAESDWGTVLQ
jgi:hypothetical protein